MQVHGRVSLCGLEFAHLRQRLGVEATRLPTHFFLSRVCGLSLELMLGLCCGSPRKFEAPHGIRMMHAGEGPNVIRRAVLSPSIQSVFEVKSHIACSVSNPRAEFLVSKAVLKIGACVMPRGDHPPYFFPTCIYVDHWSIRTVLQIIKSRACASAGSVSSLWMFCPPLNMHVICGG